MHSLRLAICLLTCASLSACGLGETAAVASLEAKQAKQAQQQMQQMQQMQQQIDQANALSEQRLKNLESQQQ